MANGTTLIWDSIQAFSLMGPEVLDFSSSISRQHEVGLHKNIKHVLGPLKSEESAECERTIKPIFQSLNKILQKLLECLSFNSKIRLTLNRTRGSFYAFEHFPLCNFDSSP